MVFCIEFFNSYAQTKKIYEYSSIFVIYGIVYTKNNLKMVMGKSKRTKNKETI